MKAPFSDTHLGFTRKKCVFEYSDSIFFFDPTSKLGLKCRNLKLTFQSGIKIAKSLVSAKVLQLAGYLEHGRNSKHAMLRKGFSDCSCACLISNCQQGEKD